MLWQFSFLQNFYFIFSFAAIFGTFFSCFPFYLNWAPQDYPQQQHILILKQYQVFCKLSYHLFMEFTKKVRWRAPYIHFCNKHFAYLNTSYYFLSYFICHWNMHSESGQTSKMELFPKIVNSLRPWTILAKSSIFDVWLGFEYASVVRVLIRFSSHTLAI